MSVRNMMFNSSLIILMLAAQACSNQKRLAEACVKLRNGIQQYKAVQSTTTLEVLRLLTEKAERGDFSNFVATEEAVEASNRPRYDPAIAFFKQAVELRPKLPLARLWLAAAYRAQGKREEAITEQW